MMSAANITLNADVVTALRRRLQPNGYPPVPVAGPRMRCRSPGKQPVMKDWQRICASADETEICRWAKTEPGCTNTGILCGAVAGVDIDVPVLDLAAQIEAEAVAKLGSTPLRRVGRAPKVLLVYRNAKALPKMETPELFLPDGTKVQVEILGRGQQFVAYGTHPDTGRDYEWTESGPDVVPLADLPEVTEDTLREFRAAAEAILRAAGGLTQDEREKAKKLATGGAEEPERVGTTSGSTNSSSAPRSGAGGDTFFKQVNQAALNNLDVWVPKLFPKAQRQATGSYRVTSADLGRDYEEDLSIHPAGVQDFGPRRGLSPCDVLMEFGGAPSVQDAAFKLCEFLGWAPAEFGWKAAAKPKSRKTNSQDEAPAKPSRAATDDLTEDSIALAFATEHVELVVFDHTEQRWAEWDGTRWCRDGKERVFNGVREYIRQIRGSSDKTPAATARMGFASAVQRGVRADPRIAVEHDVWDADPWSLGVPDGVVDLRTGELRAGRPKEYTSRQTSVAPATPGTPTPLWNAFLAETTGADEATIAFLQRFMGYSLTGDVSEEVLAFLYGAGGNGKGVFLGTWTAILGDYAVAMPMEAFTANSGVKLEYYRAQMAGHRLVTASETETGATWAESQIKELTGNEAPVSARHPHGRPFTYRPQFKLGVVGNHAPRLKGRSAAMERRLRVIPFDRTPAIPDLDLKTKLRVEYPAILRWMIGGCLEWQRDRLGSSPAIAKATSTYFEAQDNFGRWMAERCILDPSLSERPSHLQADFAAWVRSSGEQAALTGGEFREAVERTKGLKYATNGGVRWVRGIGLRSNDHEPEQ